MASTSASDAWNREFGEAMKVAEEVFEQINERSEVLMAGGDVSQLTAAARRKIAKLTNKTERLESMLKQATESGSLSERERRRREDMVLGVRFKAKQMQNVLASAQQSNRAALSRLGEAVETEHTAGLDNRGLVQLQKETMREQDDSLADLESTVKSTKHIASAINSEWDLQTHLLDECEGDVDSTNSRFKAAQKKIAAVAKRANETCNLVFLLLTVAGVVLVLLVLLELAKIFL